MPDSEVDFDRDPYSLDSEAKDRVLTEELLRLTEHHREHCRAYANMLCAISFDPSRVKHYRDLPYLPVGLFKQLRLSSIDDDAKDYKVATSSGTSGQQKSQIILDADTRTMQQRALAAIGCSYFGDQRLAMLVIDCPATVKSRNYFSARTAGIIGFSLFGTHRTFALRDEDMSLDYNAARDFLEKYGEKPFLVFGFTFIVWQKLCLELESKGETLNMKNAILIHGGGWKKFEIIAVSRDEFSQRLRATCGIERIHEYYGMAEQTGSIFMQCECGHLHCSDYSGILVRRAEDFSVCEPGEKGIIQTLSVLPRSYPGHSLLTEDEGTLLGVDDCPCGRKGAYFSVSGRLKNAELRGCSDTYAAAF